MKRKVDAPLFEIIPWTASIYFTSDEYEVRDDEVFSVKKRYGWSDTNGPEYRTIGVYALRENAEERVRAEEKAGVLKAISLRGHTPSSDPAVPKGPVPDISKLCP